MANNAIVLKRGIQPQSITQLLAAVTPEEGCAALVMCLLLPSPFPAS